MAPPLVASLSANAGEKDRPDVPISAFAGETCKPPPSASAWFTAMAEGASISMLPLGACRAGLVLRSGATWATPSTADGCDRRARTPFMRPLRHCVDDDKIGYHLAISAGCTETPCRIHDRLEWEPGKRGFCMVAICDPVLDALRIHFLGWDVWK